MPMKIEQLGPTRYRLFWELGRTKDGRRQQKTRVVHCSKREAERQWREEQARIDTGKTRIAGDLTISEAAERYLAEATLTLRPRTLTLYTMLIRNHIVPQIGDVPLDTLTAEQVRVLIAKVAAGGTIRSAQLVRHVLSQICQRENVLGEDPAKKVRNPKIQAREMLYWNEQEYRQFLASTKDHYLYPLFVTALASGMRIGELLGLQWQDIDFNRGRISVRRQLNRDRTVSPPKTRRSLRQIDIGRDAVDVLRLHQQQMAQHQEILGYPPTPFVFVTSNGTPYSARNISRAFELLTCHAGVRRIRLHDLRHTHSTMILARGVNMRVLSDRLGHSSVSFTMQTYAHVLPGMQRQAADVSDQALFGDTNGDIFLITGSSS